jgi:hypothetical protein
MSLAVKMVAGMVAIVVMAGVGLYFYGRQQSERPAEPPKKHEVTLKWDATPNAKSYVVYRRPYKEKESAKVATVNEPTYVDSAVASEEIYCYAIASVDAKDREGKKSKEHCVTVPWP